MAKNKTKTQAQVQATVEAPKPGLYRRKEGFGPLTVIVSSGRAYTISHETPGPLPEEALEILKNTGLIDTVEPVE